MNSGATASSALTQTTETSCCVDCGVTITSTDGSTVILDTTSTVNLNCVGPVPENGQKFDILTVTLDASDPKVMGGFGVSCSCQPCDANPLEQISLTFTDSTTASFDSAGKSAATCSVSNILNGASTDQAINLFVSFGCVGVESLASFLTSICPADSTSTFCAFLAVSIAGAGSTLKCPGFVCDDGNAKCSTSNDCGSDEVCLSGCCEVQQCEQGQASCLSKACPPGTDCNSATLCCDALTCGNHQLDQGETCDTDLSGAVLPGPGCTPPNDATFVYCTSKCSACRWCGDGICDKDGPHENSSDCPQDCTSSSTCGNGILDEGEQCDPGIPGVPCRSEQTPFCVPQGAQGQCTCTAPAPPGP